LKPALFGRTIGVGVILAPVTSVDTSFLDNAVRAPRRGRRARTFVLATLETMR
jgi:hypothetical protein